MKKFINISIIAALFVFASCEDVTDEFVGLDSSVKNAQKLEGTFDADAYESFSKIALELAKNKADTTAAEAIAKDLALNERWTSDLVIPGLLLEMYYSMDKGSSYNATYRVNAGRADYISDYESASSYYLKDADYESVGNAVKENLSFFPSLPASKYMNEILLTNFENAVENDLVNVNYDYSPVDGASAKVFYLQDFSSYSNKEVLGTDDHWTQYFEKGGRDWQAREYGGNAYGQFSANGSGEENVTYLITESIDIEDDEPLFSFDVNIGFWTHAPLEILISADYDGTNFAEATWSNVTSNFTIPTEPDQYYGDFGSAGEMALEDFSGKVHIAFKYTGDGNSGLTTTIQIDNILIKSAGIENTRNTDMYQFDGSEWNEASNIIVLDAAEYNAMGAPGKHGNFSSSAAPENYLPTYLASVFTYPPDGDSILIGYKYYSGGTKFFVDKYEFLDDKWSKASEIMKESQQFIFDGSKWVFDPSITFDLEEAEYQTLVDYVASSNELKKFLGEPYKDNPIDNEYYFGSNSHYENFSFRLKDRSTEDTEIVGKTGEEVAVIMLDRIITEGLPVILTKKYPNSEPLVSGVQVYYYPVIKTYQEGNKDVYYKAKYKCTGAGTFEFVEKEELK